MNKVHDILLLQMATLLCLYAICTGSIAQQRPVRPFEVPLKISDASADVEFQFVRIVYDGGYEWPRWSADWPEAEFHFSQGVNRLTRLRTATQGKVLSLQDSALFDHPWIYMVEVGHLSLSESESDNLREYLLRGGFLMIDDFHGSQEWRHFIGVFKSVFPDRALVELDSDAEIFHIHLPVSERIQIPGIRSVMRNRTWEKGGYNPGWYGIHDDSGRVMVVVNFNQDIGDAWEHADDARYPAAYTFSAYRIGINYVLYAMTH